MHPNGTKGKGRGLKEADGGAKYMLVMRNLNKRQYKRRLPCLVTNCVQVLVCCCDLPMQV